MQDNLNVRDERSSRGKSGRRQTVLSGRKGKVYANFIEPSTGLTAVAKASEQDPIIFTAANGFSLNGQVDYITKLSEDQVFENLVPNATNYLGFERSSEISVNPIITTSEPIYDSVFGDDRDNKVCATFDGSIGQTIFNDLYGNVFKAVGGPSIDSGHPGSGVNSLRFNGVGYVEVTPSRLNLNTLRSWTMEMWFKVDNSAGPTQFLFSSENSSTYGIQIYKPNASSVLQIDIGNQTSSWLVSGSGGSTPSNTWVHLAIVKTPRNVKTYMGDAGDKLFMVNNLDITDNAGHGNKYFLGSYNTGSSSLSGNISNFAIWPYAKYTTDNSEIDGIVDFIPSSSNLTYDMSMQDRYLSVKDRFLVNLESAAVNTSTFKETYGHEVIFRTYSGGYAQPYITSTTGPGSFGTVKVVDNFESLGYLEIENIRFPRTWTLESFFYFDSNAAPRWLFTSKSDSSDYQGFSINSNGNNLQINISSNGSTWNIANNTVPTTLNTGEWYHIAIVYDGSSYKLYKNATEIASYASPFNIYQPRNIKIAGIAGGTSFYGKVFLPMFTPYAKTVSVPTVYPTPEDVYYHDIRKAKTYKGYHNNWTEVNAVFVGEVDTGNANIVKTPITYSINGEVFINGIDEGGAGVSSNPQTWSVYAIHLAHMIGTSKVSIDYWFEVLKDFADKKIGQKTKPSHYYGTYNTQLDPVDVIDRNTFSLLRGDSGWYVTNNFSSVTLQGSNENGRWQFKVTRDF